MIKFFRQIRQRLLSEGKTRKYLKYAVGEIVLVVIGILIALQINDWNEKRKNSKRENVILNEIKNELSLNAKRLKSCAKNDSISVKSYDIIIDYLQNKKSFTDSLSYHFAEIIEWCAYDIVSTSYNSLKQTLGIDLISEPSLRSKIVTLYEKDYPFGVNNINLDESNVHNILILPDFPDLFSVEYDENDNEIKFAVANDYQALLADNKFLTSLKIVRNKRNWSVEHDKKTYLKTIKTINEISEFLKEIN